MATSPSLPAGNPPADIVTAEELAAILKVDPHTVLNWAKAGIIPEAMRVGRTVRFSLEAVTASLDINNAGEGRYVETVSMALKVMLGGDFRRTPSFVPGSINVAALAEIKLQMQLHETNLKELTTTQARAHYAEGVLEAARFVVRQGWKPVG